MVKRDLNIEEWQERSPVERRGDQDKRRQDSQKYFAGSL
jgi:hypothetical protein